MAVFPYAEDFLTLPRTFSRALLGEMTCTSSRDGPKVSPTSIAMPLQHISRYLSGSESSLHVQRAHGMFDTVFMNIKDGYSFGKIRQGRR